MTRGKAKQLRQLIEQLAVTLDDETALTGVELFPAWVVGKAYAANDRAQYNGTLYKCIQAHTSQADWTPDTVPALWVKVSVEEWPEFVQPTGAHDAYNTGDKVTYNGKRYVSLIDANVYSPDDYPAGWEEQV